MFISKIKHKIKIKIKLFDEFYYLSSPTPRSCVHYQSSQGHDLAK